MPPAEIITITINTIYRIIISSCTLYITVPRNVAGPTVVVFAARLVDIDRFINV